MNNNLENVNENAEARDLSHADPLEIAKELVHVLDMKKARGIKLLPVDVYKSHPEDFVIEAEKSIRVPLNSLPGLGLSAAENIARIREDGPFISQEDMIRRKVSKSIVEMLKNVGALGDMPESSQVSLFDML